MWFKGGLHSDVKFIIQMLSPLSWWLSTALLCGKLWFGACTLEPVVAGRCLVCNLALSSWLKGITLFLPSLTDAGASRAEGTCCGYVLIEASHRVI